MFTCSSLHHAAQSLHSATLPQGEGDNDSTQPVAQASLPVSSNNFIIILVPKVLFGNELISETQFRIQTEFVV